MLTAENRVSLLSADTRASRIPEAAILRELRKLTPGTKVGLMTPPELHDPKTRDDLLARTDYPLGSILSPEYWIAMVDYCRALGLDIIFLGSMRLESEFARFSRQSLLVENNIREKFGEALGDRHAFYGEGRYIPSEYLTEELVISREAHFKAEAEADYYFVTARVEYAKKVLVQSPVLVIVSDEYSGDDLVNTENLAISSYREASVQNRGKSGRRMQVLVDRKFAQYNRMQRERAIRGHRIANEWRVTSGTPDFIGTFDSSRRNAGLFEVFVEGVDSNGTQVRIEDYFGTSYGKINFDDQGRRIKFYKVYDPEKSIGAAKGAVEYFGVATSGGYKGRWRYGVNHDSFVMLRGSEFPRNLFPS